MCVKERETSADRKETERQRDGEGVEGVLNSIVLKMFISFLNTYLIYYLAGFQCTFTLHFQQRRS